MKKFLSILLVLTLALSLGVIGFAEGEEERTCKREGCTATETQSIEKLQHKYTGEIKSDGNGKDATHSFKCVNGCNDYGAATKHIWNDGQITDEAACLTGGMKAYTCTANGCGATYTETISAKGHARLVFEWNVHVECAVCFFCLIIRKRGMGSKTCNIRVCGQFERRRLVQPLFDALLYANSVFLRYVC